MLTQFFLEHLRFALYLISALVALSVFWLYADAWLASRKLKNALVPTGFLLIALSFFLQATQSDSLAFHQLVTDTAWLGELAGILRAIGYGAIITYLVADPLTEHPFRAKPKRRALAVAPLSLGTAIALPILAATAGFLYLRRATRGLEHHLKPLSFSLYLLGFYELVGMTTLFRDSRVVDVHLAVAPFGPLWVLQLGILTMATMVLATWVFGYLLKQFLAQLMILMSLLVVSIAIVTTLVFSSLLVGKVSDQVAAQADTSVGLLAHAITLESDKLAGDARQVAALADVQASVQSSDKAALGKLSRDTLLARKATTLIIVDRDGRILARGDDEDAVGDALTGDKIITTALTGTEVSTIARVDGMLIPTVELRTAVPVRAADQTVGAVLLTSALDQSFVDGIYTRTNLPFVILSGATITASSLKTSDGKASLAGLELPQSIKKQLTHNGFTGPNRLTLGNRSYVTSFYPLKNHEGNAAAAIMVGIPESSLLSLTAQAVSGTYALGVALVVISLLPAYLIAQSIVRQIA